MTRLLIRIADAEEAVAALAAGADILELRFDDFGDDERTLLRDVRAVFAGQLRLSLVEGNEVASVDDADEFVVPASWLSGVGSGKSVGSVATVARVTIGIDDAETIRGLRGRVDRVTIESGAAERLFDRAGIAQLDTLAEACRTAALPFGFAGGLEAPDIPRLLMLRPDVLGFDVAVRDGHRIDGRLLPHAIEAVRELIPRGGVPPVDRGSGAHDTIFVRDFVVAMSIGAYRIEEKARQRVRFSVEATIVRRAGPPRDMRDVFSYDVILETIRVLAERSHVAFVETLAEEVAAVLLTHAGIVGVTVEVEKLDVIDGAVGIRIVRAPPADAP